MARRPRGGQAAVKTTDSRRRAESRQATSPSGECSRPETGRQNQKNVFLFMSVSAVLPVVAQRTTAAYSSALSIGYIFWAEVNSNKKQKAETPWPFYICCAPGNLGPVSYVCFYFPFLIKVLPGEAASTPGVMLPAAFYRF